MKNYYKLITLVLFILFSQKSLAQCQPTNLRASTSAAGYTNFEWDIVPAATHYIFEIKRATDPWRTGGGLMILPTIGWFNESYGFQGLAESFSFTWRVTAYCSGQPNVSSDLTYTVPCPIPRNATVSNITTTTATINWASSSVQPNASFAVGYRLANTTNAWTSAGNTTATSITISGLLSNTAYEFCVNQRCVYSNSDPLSGQFITLPVPCSIPTNLVTSLVSSNQATVSWSLVSGATYTIDYKPTTSSTWFTTTSTTNSKILTGLVSATLYDVRVKANCTSNISNYVTSQFTTYSSSCAAWGVNSSEFIDLFSLGSINRTSVREVGGYYNTGLSTNLVIGSTTNPGLFSAGFNPGITFGENYAVYIDFNRNGTFTDVGETVVNPFYFVGGSSVFNFNIEIPATATAGNTKMRVVMRRSGTAIVPCSTGFRGEVEDYDVNLVVQSLRMASSDTKDLSEMTIVYPNPTNGYFNVQIAENFEASYFEIINMQGVIINKQNISSLKTFSVDLSSHDKGLYLLNIISSKDNTKITKRISVE